MTEDEINQLIEFVIKDAFDVWRDARREDVEAAIRKWLKFTSSEEPLRQLSELQKEQSL